MQEPAIIEKAARILESRRNRAEYELEMRRKECLGACPAILQVEQELVSVCLEAAKMVISGNASRETELEKKSFLLQGRLEQLLASIKKPVGYLKIKYLCEKCRDTGMLQDKQCECSQKLISELYAQRLNKNSPLKFCDFKDFKLDYYSKEINSAYGISPLENMENVLNFMKEYSASFSHESKSLLLWGNPGLGKTHLALACAREAVNKGYGAVYIPSHILFERMNKERFSKDESSDVSDSVLECDLLVLDDLGTEMNTPFIQMQLYNVVNTRLLTSKPTIVSTNFDLDEMRLKYPPRLVSRLTGSYEDLLFIGKDIRLIKKYSQIGGENNDAQ